MEKFHSNFFFSGESPTDSRRWEVTAMFTTPHEDYEKFGFSSVYAADGQRPVFDLQVNWPAKQIGLNFEAKISKDPEMKSLAQLHILTPYPRLENVLLTGGYLLTSPVDFEV